MGYLPDGVFFWVTLLPRPSLNAETNITLWETRKKKQAQEAVAVTIVGHGNTKNLWNGYSEVQTCSHVNEEEKSGPAVGLGGETVEVELPFPDGRKGFNIVNM